MKVVNTDYQGNASTSRFSYSLEVASGYLSFTGKVENSSFLQETARVTLQENLWKEDAVELFLSNPRGQYLEFHVASSGRWWFCFFLLFRKRGIADEPLVRVISETDLLSKTWVTTLSIPISYIEDCLGEFANITGNVTSCINGSYLSVAKLSGEKPDFHQPTQFLPIMRLVS